MIINTMTLERAGFGGTTGPAATRGLRPRQASVRRLAAPAIVLALALLTKTVGIQAHAQSLQTDWVVGHNVRTRLIAGHVQTGSPAPGSQGAVTSLAAGIEMQLSPGWKTYWRVPGDAGGVPPEFDWSGSENLVSATVHYPAPRRLTDRAGSTIGYKERVVFPVLIEPKDAARPVKLHLQMAFGVCHDICVPSEGTYQLTLAPGVPLSSELMDALTRVPMPVANADQPPGKSAPRLVKVETALAGAEPSVTLHVAFPNGAEAADVFVEGPVGEYVPMTNAKGMGSDGTHVYVIDLSQGADIDALKGQSLRVTMVSGAGHAEANFTLK